MRTPTCTRCGCTYPAEHAGVPASSATRRARQAEAQSAAPRTEPSRVVTVESEYQPDGSVDYDQAFRPAVSSGLMTVQQAVERGDRAAYASRVAKRHGLSMEAALKIADNQLTLAQAVGPRLKAVRLLQMEREYVSMGWALGGVVAAIALVGAIGGAIWLVSADADGRSIDQATAKLVRDPVPVPHVKAASEVRTNAEGHVTEIRALDPQSVLAAYCKSVRASTPPVPIRIARTAGEDRLGVFNERGRLQAIPIRKDEGSVYWIAGNGKDPILPVDPALK